MTTADSFLTPDQKETIKAAISASSSKILYATLVRIYYAYPQPTKWTYTGLQGGLAIVRDTSKKFTTFKLVDLDGNRGVIWEHELYENFDYSQDRSTFHSFPGDECMIAFVFADSGEAKTFAKKASSKDLSKSVKKSKSEKKKKVGKGGRIDKSMISAPTAFVHIAHMGYDDEHGFTSRGVDTSWLDIGKDLQSKGVPEDIIEKEKDFIRQFMAQNQQKDMKKPKPPPPPSRRSHVPDASPTPSVQQSAPSNTQTPPPRPTAIAPPPPSRVPPKVASPVPLLSAPPTVSVLPPRSAPPPPPPPSRPGPPVVPPPHPRPPASPAPPVQAPTSQPLPPPPSHVALHSLPPPSSASHPPPPPPPPPSSASHPPPPPPPPPPSSASHPPPPPPPPPPPSSASHPPPPPPPPPPPSAGPLPPPPFPSSGVNGDVPNVPASTFAPQAGRNALLASIQGAGVHSLRKTETSTAPGQKSAPNGEASSSPVTSAAPAGGSDLTSALAAALLERNKKLGDSDSGEEEEEDDWD